LCSVTLVSGYAYTTVAACALISCDLALDGIGDGAGPAWKFTCGGALSTAAGRKVVLSTDSGATADVLWSIGGATGTGAGSVLVGTLESVGAIALGADTQWTGGNLESFNGAVATGAGCDVSGNIKAYGAVALGASASAKNVFAAGVITLGAGATKTNRRLLREVVVVV
jgi:hypothetical protein